MERAEGLAEELENSMSRIDHYRDAYAKRVQSLEEFRKARNALRAAEDSVRENISVPIQRLKDIGQSVVRKEWGTEALRWWGRNISVEYPATETYDWVMHPFSVGVLEEDTFTINSLISPQRIDGSIRASLLGAQDAQVEEHVLPVGILSMSDREFATRVRSAVAERKAEYRENLKDTVQSYDREIDDARNHVVELEAKIIELQTRRGKDRLTQRR